MKKRRVIVTNHALLRYLERVGGFDIEGLRRAIEQQIEAKTPEGASAIILDGHRYVLRDGGPAARLVVTVMPQDCSLGMERPRG